MATGTETRAANAFREVYSTELYKRNQGRRSRQLTALGVGLLAMWGLKILADRLNAEGVNIYIAYGVPFALMAASAWAIFRLVNLPRFADFLIATEAEMAKVSWSTKTELKRATLVVLTSMFFLAAFLFVVDLVWTWVLETIGVLRPNREPTVPAEALVEFVRTSWFV